MTWKARGFQVPGFLASFWQNGFWRKNSRILLGLMVGLGGLEPPTSLIRGRGDRGLRNDLKNPRKNGEWNRSAPLTRLGANLNTTLKAATSPLGGD
jgi:hypothetical protein